jgi:hypothetical protein
MYLNHYYYLMNRSSIETVDVEIFDGQGRIESEVRTPQGKRS